MRRFLRATAEAAAFAFSIGGLACALLYGASLYAQPVYPPQLAQNGDAAAPSVRGTSPLLGGWFGSNFFGVAGHAATAQHAGTLSVSSCGTGSLATGSTDRAGKATATGATGCTVNFGSAYVTAPFCVVTDLTGTRAGMSVTVGTGTLVIAGMTSGDAFAWNCIANSGG